MAIFNLLTQASKEIRKQSDLIDQKYFTIDTASENTIHSWNDYNRHAFTAAMLGDVLYGFFTVLPVSAECAALFERKAILEEDLTTDLVLLHESVPYAEYAYIPAIAVLDTKDYLSRQCVAALTAGLADLFLNAYGSRLKRIYANPTTFEGNNFVRKMGMKPISGFKQLLTGNDMYAMDVTPETIATLKGFSDRYQRFIGTNPWAK